jgi:RimJ/RimL family protein N-acetyltransferase
MAAEPPTLALGDGLQLEPLRSADAAALAPALRDPDLAAWNEHPSGDAEADARRLVSDLLERAGRGEAAPFLVRRDGGEPLGLLCADMAGDREVAELGIWIRREERSRGLARRATRALAEWLLAAGVERVWLEIDPENAASLRVAERAGFRYEGLLRAHCRDRRSGRRHDCRIYSLVRADLANAEPQADG